MYKLKSLCYYLTQCNWCWLIEFIENTYLSKNGRMLRKIWVPFPRAIGRKFQLWRTILWKIEHSRYTSWVIQYVLFPVLIMVLSTRAFINGSREKVLILVVILSSDRSSPILLAPPSTWMVCINRFHLNEVNKWIGLIVWSCRHFTMIEL